MKRETGIKLEVELEAEAGVEQRSDPEVGVMEAETNIDHKITHAPGTFHHSYDGKSLNGKQGPPTPKRQEAAHQRELKRRALNE